MLLFARDGEARKSDAQDSRNSQIRREGIRDDEKPKDGEKNDGEKFDKLGSDVWSGSRHALRSDIRISAEIRLRKPGARTHGGDGEGAPRWTGSGDGGR